MGSRHANTDHVPKQTNKRRETQQGGLCIIYEEIYMLS